MRRRALLQLATAMLAAPLGSFGQPRIHRLAWLAGGSPATQPPYWRAFFAKLEELGFREGRNLAVERRFAEGNYDRLPGFAAELVALKPDVLVTPTTPPTLAAAKATGSIPIVFVGVADPVAAGIVKSLARPGTNATGLSGQNYELIGKRMQLLKEILPGARRVAVLHNPRIVSEVPAIPMLEDAARALGLALRIVETASDADFERAFRSIDAVRPDALWVIEGAFSLMHRARIVAFANGSRLPSVYGMSEAVDAGGLMSYANDPAELFRAAASYVAKIMKGAKPADLPVEQPMRFEFVINLKTAREIGVKIPPSVLFRADRVIE